MLQTLSRALMLGTERGAVGLPAAAGKLGEALAKVDAADSEKALLQTVSLLALYEDAGRQARPAADRPTVAPAETLPPCSPAAGATLLRVLAHDNESLVSEWLQLAAAAGVLAPPAGLPNLLGQGRRHRQLRPLLAAVIGERGRWLAAQNDEWSYAVVSAAAIDDQRLWDQGTHAERLRFLSQLRDTDPAAARALLVAELPQEKARHRTELIEVLATGLDSGDEPLLESMLDDRSKEVQAAAAALLSRLPGSAFCGRMKDRLSALVTVDQRLRVEPPEEADAAMVRDGLTMAKIGQGLGDRASLLLQLVANTPLAWWAETLQREPSQIIDEAPKTNWAAALWWGWVTAATRQGNSDWALALLAVKAPKKVQVDRRQLLTAVGPERRDEWLLTQTSRDAKGWLKDIGLHCADGAAWSVRLSERVVQCLTDYLTSTKLRDDWELSYLIPRFAVSLAPATLIAVAGGFPGAVEGTPSRDEAVAEFLTIANLRIEMHKEFS